MKYEVTWHDYEDGRSGSPITVEAPSPLQAFRMASTELDKLVGKPNMHFIETLTDESGRVWSPDGDLPGTHE